MKQLALAATAALTLVACGSMDGGKVQSAAAAPRAGTQYCWQDRLSNSGGKLNCNWAATKREACEVLAFSDVEAARYSAPRKSTMCSNGQWLVEVAPTG